MFYKKKYEELLAKYNDMVENYSRLKRKFDDYKSLVSGERVVNDYCEKCKNGIWFSNGCWGHYDCVLNAKCKDFERKEEVN